MADFECPVVRIEEITPIEGADRIEAVRIGGYRSIVQKGAYQVGDLAVYIPCGSLLPMKIQEELGLVGKLSGKNKDRVKEIKLKGVLSEGLVLPLAVAEKLNNEAAEGSQGCDVYDLSEGRDVSKLLGVTKYEPQVPATMMGRVKPYPFTLGYDIENFKKYPNVLQRGELVAISEKIHGTLMQVGLVHKDDGTIFTYVTSKGLGKAGLIIEDNPANDSNLYLGTARAYGLVQKLIEMDEGKDLYLFGEVYGVGIQDLGYGAERGGSAVYGHFRTFDIYEGKKGQGRFLDFGEFEMICEAMDIPTVNYLFVGPYSDEARQLLTDGKETISGYGLHIREGVVIRPCWEREARGLGRVVLKSVSEAYLLRKNGTEFN